MNGKVYASVNGDFTLVYRCIESRIVQPPIYIFMVDRQPPLSSFRAGEAYIPIHDNFGSCRAFRRGFSPPVCFLDGDPVSAFASCHFYMERCIDGDFARFIFCCVQPDGGCFCFSSCRAVRVYGQFLCIYRHVFPISRIDAHRGPHSRIGIDGKGFFFSFQGNVSIVSGKDAGRHVAL